MCRKVLLLMFCCWALNASAHDADTSKWSIGVNAFRLSRMYFDTRIVPELLPGIIIKRRYKKYALRLAAEYEQQDLETPSSKCCDEINKVGKNDVFSARVGFERNLFKVHHTFRTYAALDVQFAYLHSNYSETGGLHPYYFRQISDVFILGLNPTIGVGYRLTPRIALNMETRALLYSDRANYKSTTSTANIPASNGYKTEFGFTFRDIISAVTLNVRL